MTPPSSSASGRNNNHPAAAAAAAATSTNTTIMSLEEGRTRRRGDMDNPRDGRISNISEFTTTSNDEYEDDVYSDEEEEGDSDEEEEEVDMSTSDNGTTNENTPRAHQNNITWYKNGIFLSKFVVIVALIGSAIAASIWIYRFTSHQESNSFEEQFINQAEDIIQVSSGQVTSIFSSLQTLSHAITSVSLVEQQTHQWPLMKVPHFDVRARDFLTSIPTTSSGTAAAIQAIAVAPLVASKDRLDYESFVVSSSSTVHNNNSSSSTRDVTTTLAAEVQPYIWQPGFRPGEQLRDYSSGPYLPVSQIFHPTTTTTSHDDDDDDDDDHNNNNLSKSSDMMMINFNLMASPTIPNLVDVAISTRQSVVSPVLNPEEEDDLIIGSFGSGSSSIASPTSSPKSSILLQPVFQDFDPITSEIVAFVVVVVRWDILLEEALMIASDNQDSYPVVTVLQSLCGQDRKNEQSYAFLMDGRHGIVDFLGEGGYPGSSYDDDDGISNGDGTSSSSSSLVGSNEYHGGSLLSSSDDRSYCSYSLYIYPSNEMMDHFYTTTPMIATIVVGSILAFILLVFGIYVTLVERRNRQVVEAANQTNKIIHNLFPQQVHDRLFQNNGIDASLQSNHDTTTASQKRRGRRGGRRRGRRRRRGGKKKNFRYQPTKNLLSNFLSDESRKTATETDDDNDDNNNSRADGEMSGSFKSKPIADLFPEATVMFCDIAGFTAWSSVREPSQVFTLLENVYNSFDGIAKRRKVFKVETIGDSYLAVAGLPTPRKDHATVMVRFASDCMTQFDVLCQELETELGPGTSELCMRFGLHSGPVTAGVLRGEKTRFQLFGDTVNTASRMESTGERGKIQVSTATANLLNEAHKRHWCERRKEPVQAKGKGEMITYWVNPKTSVAGGSQASYLAGARTWTSSRALGGANISERSVVTPAPATSNESQGQEAVINPEQERHPESTPELENSTKDGDEPVCPKLQRSISFISGVLLALLRQIVARRLAMGRKTIGQTQATRQARMAMQPEPGTLVLDEMEEIISLPKFDPKATRRFVDPETVELPTEVVEQLHSFVTVVALMYQENPFHNFHHATHVTMSVSKLLSRIVAPEDLDGGIDNNDWSSKRRAYESKLHDHTFGITSDPITQFAVIFSAMIHDVDHPGVPNSVLVSNETEIANHYRNKSVAEQNSLDVAWDLLMDDAYADLCACIFTNETELGRFRQLVVNTVLATDIADSELNSLRKTRWDKAFSAPTEEGGIVPPKPGRAEFVSVADDRNRKATIVIEHLIQASDVAHTMQHWEVYIGWNEKLFEEMYTAYLNGHLDSDPSKRWYEGELGFFDYYIIPLANKLGECGVFGVSSTEYLSYAVENRWEWESKGRQIVEDYLRKYRPVKECHFKDDLSGSYQGGDQKIGACRDIGGSSSMNQRRRNVSSTDDAAAAASCSSGGSSSVISTGNATTGTTTRSSSPRRVTTKSARPSRSVDQLFNASYHQRSDVAPLD